MTGLSIAAIGFTVLLAGTVVVVRSLVLSKYRPDRVPHDRTPADLGISYEEIRFPTAGGGTLSGWWIGNGDDAPLVIVVHGWSRNAGRVLPHIKKLHSEGFTVLAFDLRCHGDSTCKIHATLPRFSEDIRAAVDEAVRQGVTSNGISVMGLSVGGAAAIHAASSDRRIGAVVTVGAFAHPGDAMAFELQNRGMPRWAIGPFLRWIEWEVGFRFNDVAPEARIASVDCPVLLVHGGRDLIIPAEHGDRLAAAGNSNVRILRLPEFGHSDCDRAPKFWPSVLETLSTTQNAPDSAR